MLHVATRCYTIFGKSGAFLGKKCYDFRKMYYICHCKKECVLSHVFLSMDELKLTMNDGREAHYEPVLSPFGEFLPSV